MTGTDDTDINQSGGESQYAMEQDTKTCINAGLMYTIDVCLPSFSQMIGVNTL